MTKRMKPLRGGPDERVSRGRAREGAAFPVPASTGKLSDSYTAAFAEIKERIREERLRVVLTANAALVLLCWDIGRAILDRQEHEGRGARVIDGKPVVTPPCEVQEARNAIKAYELYPRRDPSSETDLLNTHAVLMAGLLDAPGYYRRGGVTVTGAGEVHHIDPPADRVPHLMSDLLLCLGNTTEHPLIASSVFYYEFEFIHPFEDGNGRIARRWQVLILTGWKPLFANVPVESLIPAQQGEYNEAIRESSAKGQSTPFHRFHAAGYPRSHSGFPDNRAGKRPSNRPSSTIARRPVGRFEDCDRTHGRLGLVAPPHFPQQLHSPGTLRRAGGNDPSRVADGEEPEVPPHSTWRGRNTKN